MVEWLAEQAWAAWLVLAILLAAAEALTFDAMLMMLAGGAVAASVVAGLGAPLAWQIVVAIVVAAALLALVRPVVVRRLHRGPERRMNVDAMVGRRGLVLEQVDRYGGQVRVGGETWTARAADERSVIAQGTTVDVVRIEGATALVDPTED